MLSLCFSTIEMVPTVLFSFLLTGWEERELTKYLALMPTKKTKKKRKEKKRKLKKTAVVCCLVSGEMEIDQSTSHPAVVDDYHCHRSAWPVGTFQWPQSRLDVVGHRRVEGEPVLQILYISPRPTSHLKHLCLYNTVSICFLAWCENVDVKKLVDEELVWNKLEVMWRFWVVSGMRQQSASIANSGMNM